MRGSLLGYPLSSSSFSRTRVLALVSWLAEAVVLTALMKRGMRASRAKARSVSAMRISTRLMPRSSARMDLLIVSLIASATSSRDRSWERSNRTPRRPICPRGPCPRVRSRPLHGRSSSPASRRSRFLFRRSGWTDRNSDGGSRHPEGRRSDSRRRGPSRLRRPSAILLPEMDSGRERDVPESGLAGILHTVAVGGVGSRQIHLVAKGKQTNRIVRVLADDDDHVGARLDRFQPGHRQSLTRRGESRHVLRAANQLARKWCGDRGEDGDQSGDDEHLQQGKTPVYPPPPGTPVAVRTVAR